MPKGIYIRTKEHRKKLSETIIKRREQGEIVGFQKENNNWDNENSKKSWFKKGDKVSEKIRKKISISNTGIKDNKETKKRKSIAVRKRIKDGTFKGFEKGNKMRLGLSAWNKDLTKETNEIVANLAKKKEGVKRSEETCKNISKSLKGKYVGENACNWRDGKSFEPYGLEFNNKLKEKIRKRDNYKCKLCNVDESQLKQRLNIHHIDYDKQNNSENNLISLCLSCHMKTNFKRDYWEKLFKTI